MTTLAFNPFTWDDSSEMVQSSVTSLDLQNSHAKKMNVSNLENDIEIAIPISSPRVTNSSEAPEEPFLKPGKMSIRRYNAELGNVPVSMEMGVSKEGIVMELFVRFGSRPTIVDFDQNFTLAFTSICENQTEGNRYCTVKDASVKVVPPESGVIYIGVLYLAAKNVTEHSRKRRSCFGHGRERRSCVGLKDPPPLEEGVIKTVVPQYDPSTDVKYAMTVTQASCLYWSDDKQKWTSDGCKVNFVNIYYYLSASSFAGERLAFQ